MTAALQGKWHPASRLPRALGSLRRWLTEPGSLTARCQQNCRHFKVKLIKDQLGYPISHPSKQLQHLREVLLLCDDHPVIFAHTTLARHPRGCLHLWLQGLGERSLGSLLFRCKTFKRGPIEYRRLDSRHPLFQRASSLVEIDAPYLWARRSRHQLGAQSVLVTEVFLPGIIALPLGERR